MRRDSSSNPGCAPETELPPNVGPYDAVRRTSPPTPTVAAAATRCRMMDHIARSDPRPLSGPGRLRRVAPFAAGAAAGLAFAAASQPVRPQWTLLGAVMGATVQAVVHD